MTDGRQKRHLFRCSPSAEGQCLRREPRAAEGETAMIDGNCQGDNRPVMRCPLCGHVSPRHRSARMCNKGSCRGKLEYYGTTPETVKEAKTNASNGV